MKTMVCPNCELEVEVEDKVRRKYCLCPGGYLMKVKLLELERLSS